VTVKQATELNTDSYDGEIQWKLSKEGIHSKRATSWFFAVLGRLYYR